MSHCPWVVAYKENIDMVPQLMGHILAIAPPKLFLNNMNALSIASLIPQKYLFFLSPLGTSRKRLKKLFRRGDDKQNDRMVAAYMGENGT